MEACCSLLFLQSTSHTVLHILPFSPLLSSLSSWRFCPALRYCMYLSMHRGVWIVFTFGICLPSLFAESSSKHVGMLLCCDWWADLGSLYPYNLGVPFPQCPCGVLCNSSARCFHQLVRGVNAKCNS